MLRKVMMSFCFLMSASLLTASGSVMTLDFTKGTFVNHENPSSTSGNFKLLVETAGVHDFARRLILDFKKQGSYFDETQSQSMFWNF